MLRKIQIGVSICCVFFASIILALVYTQRVKTEGTIELKNTWGEVTISREKDTKIPHITGENFNSVIYAQGFTSA